MKPAQIAIADDDLAFASYLKAFLDTRGYQARIYDHGEALLAAAHLGDLPDVVLLDVVMPGMDGIAILRSLKAAHADVQVIMLSGREQAATIVEALKLGAVNYVVKPDDPDGLGEIALESAIKQVLESRQLASDLTALRRQVNDEQDQAFLFWGQSDTMRHIAVLVDRVADNDATVLIRGESGVGKELVARAIHERSGRRSHPFVKVNCAALPDDLLESELFGHEKGAFTGAAALRVGKFEHAAGGTLMLDEIGEMKAGLQSKLLHVLQDAEFTRLGSNKPITVDARMIAATNRNLEAMLSRAEFREDLYYRLNVIEITVPALRERPDEIPGLVEFFLRKSCHRYNRPAPTLSATIREALQHYDWPGNIRQLENIMKRFVILQDESLLLRDLQGNGHRSPASAAPETPPPALPEVSLTPPEVAAAPLPTASATDATARHGTDAPPNGIALADIVRMATGQAERDVILPTLHRVRWNRRKAAVLLGISYKTLLNKIKEHGLVRE